MHLTKNEGAVCLTCPYLKPGTMGGAQRGYCRRHAPRPEHNGQVADWPLVAYDDWCGQHPHFFGEDIIG